MDNDEVLDIAHAACGATIDAVPCGNPEQAKIVVIGAIFAAIDKAHTIGLSIPQIEELLNDSIAAYMPATPLVDDMEVEGNA